MVGNIRRCRKHVRAIDLLLLLLSLVLSLSLSSFSTQESPNPVTSSSSSLRVSVAFEVPDFGVATGRGASEKRHTNSQERASERARVVRRSGESGTSKGGATIGGGYPARYLNLRLPRGRAQKCKAIVSQPRPVSSSAGSLLCPRKGVTYRDTRESTEGLDISRRSATVVAAWFRARFTARERTTYGIPVEVRWRFLLLSVSSFSRLHSHVSMCARVCVLCLPPQRSSSLTSEANQPTSRIYGAQNSDDARSSSRVTSGKSAYSLSLSRFLSFFLFPEPRAYRYFSTSRLEARNTRRGLVRFARSIREEISPRVCERGGSYYFAVPRLLPT